MTDFLRINDKHIPDSSVAAIVKSLNDACNNLGIDYFMIGARAKDYWFKSFDLPVRRFTQDIDFAVLVPAIEDFYRLVKVLEEKYGFKLLESMPHRVIWMKKGIFADLIPFGGIEEAGYIHFRDRFDAVMSVEGMQEVFRHLKEFDISEQKVRLATLPGLCMLKLFSWSAKPEMRSRDLLDIFHIIEHYFEIESDLIYENHNDLFGSGDFSIIHTAARVLGREIASLAGESEEIKRRVIYLLSENNGNSENPGKIPLALIASTDHNLESIIRVFDQLLKGLKE